MNADGEISNYYPDFLFKLSDRLMVVVETKGQEDLEAGTRQSDYTRACSGVAL